MYVIESSLSSTEPIMLINYSIGFDPSEPGSPYVDGALFQKELLELDGAGFKRIQVWINCPGGNVYEGYNICNAILKSNTPVDTYIAGIAASMAGAVFMCGRKRTMTDYSSLMIHNPFDPKGGGDKKQLEALRQSLVTMIAAKCSITPDAVAYLCDRETWIGPAECLEKGFCTDIEVTKEINQKRMPLVSAKAMWQEATNIRNDIFSNNNKIIPVMETPVSKIGTSLLAAYLELNVDATENAVLSEVKSKFNTLTIAKVKADEELDKMKGELQKAKDALAAMEGKFNAKVKEMEDRATADATAQAKIKKDADDVLAAAKVTEAKAMIAPFVGKRIKAEEVAKWEDAAVKMGVSETKAMIEGLPLNATATSAEASSKETPITGPLATTAMALQAKINANLKKARA